MAITKEAPSKKRKFRDIDTVTLSVGPEKARFIIHKDILCDASPFFMSAFGSKFKEGEEQKMDLPDESAEVVEAFVKWLYGLGFDGNLGILEQGRLFRLLVLTDDYHVQTLKEEIVEHICFMLRTKLLIPLHHEAIVFIYENTPETCGLRKLILDWCVWRTGYGTGAQLGALTALKGDHDFAVDFALAFWERFYKTETKNPFVSADSAEKYVHKHMLADS